jgi:hypothetical protein
MRSDDTAVTTVRRDWAGDEAVEPRAWPEARRLVGRARRRWLRTLGWAVAVAALVTATAAHRPRYFASRARLRVEGVVPGDVSRAVLSDAQLGPVVVAHGLYPTARGRKAAVAALRADLDVALDGDELVIGWHGDDAERVFQVVRDLALIVSDEQRWPLVDPGHADRGFDRATYLLLVAVAAFVLALPLVAVGVGAFDRRVYELDDVRRLGLPTLGAVRRFDGDNAGALVARMRPRDSMGPS